MPPAAIMLRVVVLPQVSAQVRSARAVCVEATMRRAIMLRVGAR